MTKKIKFLKFLPFLVSVVLIKCRENELRSQAKQNVTSKMDKSVKNSIFLYTE